MNCQVCHEHLPVLSHSAGVKMNAKGAALEIHPICEVCMAKLFMFLEELGWGLAK